MSTTVDNRIVDIKFNNAQFEQKTKQTMTTLQKLKSALNLGDASKSLGDLEKKSKSFSMDSLINAADTVSSRFSTLGIIGTTAIANIANSAVNAGKKLAAALTTDPILAGFEEYELKMNSIKTILANTEMNGSTLDDVNDALNDLNRYSDNTVYNFAQMTDMVSKFAATSGKLESSVSIVKGMSNLAASAGVDNSRLQSALYQTSQAMSGAYFQKMDWNSLENAGIATKKFKNDLVEMGKEMGAFDELGSLYDDLLNDRIGLGNSLESKWLTTDVFAAVTDMYALDEAMTKAAGEVTTLSKLFVVMKETVQSGWTETWENIVGDREQSVKFFNSIRDGFNELVGPSMRARNETLKFWNENGGRDATIQALVNAFKGLNSIFGTISKGFREVFPKKTGAELVQMSKNLEELTSKFKLSEKTLFNLKTTFKGFFAAISIGFKVFKSLTDAVFKVFSTFIKFDGSILEFTAHIGAFFVGVNKAYGTIDVFGAAANVLIEILKTLGNVVLFIGGIIYNVLSKIDFSKVFDIGGIAKGFTKGVGNMTDSLKGIQKVKNPFGWLISVKDALAGPAKVVLNIFKTIGDGVKKFVSVIVDAAMSGDINKAMDILRSGLLTGGLYYIVKAIKNISKGSSGFMSGMTDILDGIKGTLAAYQTEIKADALLKIAAAIGVLTLSLLVMSSIDANKLVGSSIALGTLLAVVMGSMAVLDKKISTIGAVKINAIAVSISIMSVGLLILASALKKVSVLNPAELAKGLIGISVMMGVLVIVAKQMSGVKKGLGKNVAGFIGLAISLNILVSALKKIGELKTGVLIKGLVGITAVMAQLVIFMKFAEGVKLGVGTASSIFILATSLLILGSAVEKMGKIDFPVMLNGLVGLGIALTGIVVFAKMMSEVKGLMRAGIMMITLSTGLLILSKAVASMGGLNIKTIGKGILGLAGSLGVIVLALNLMPKNFGGKALSLLVLSAAIASLGKTLKNLGGMSLKEMGKGLLALSGTLLVLGVAMKFMSTTMAGSAAMLIMAGALMLLTPVLLALGTMSLESIGKSLLILVGVFAVLGVAGLVLGPVVPVLLALSGAIVLLGIGALAAGVGLTLLATAITALSISGAALGQILGTMIQYIAEQIPYMAQMFAMGFIEIIRVIGENTPIIAEAIGKIISGIVQVLGENIPKVLKLIGDLLVAFIEMIAEYTPKIVDAFVKIPIAFLEALADAIPDLVDAGVNVIYAFLEGVANTMVGVVDAAFNMVITFINGLADALDNNTPALAEAIDRLFDAMIRSAKTLLGGSVGGFVAAGLGLAKGVLKGVLSIGGKIAGAFLDIGKGAIKAIKNKAGDFVDAGKEMARGLKKGIDKGKDWVVGGAKSLGKKALGGVKGVLGIKSPSKAFEWVGKMVDLGFADGMIDNMPVVTDAASEVGKASEDAMDGKGVGESFAEGTAEGIEDSTPKVASAAGKMGKTAYEKSVEWIDRRKKYVGMSLVEEIDAWKKIQSEYKLGTKERMDADLQVRDLKIKLTDEMLAVDQEYNDGVAKLRDDYIKGVADIEKTYDDAVKSRTDSIYKAYGMFDSVKVPEEPVDGNVLLQNLSNQVSAVKLWRSQIDELSEKGIGEELLQELADMGPQSINEIDALNKLTQPELDKYAELWKEKHQEARWQAVDELQGLKKDTREQIAELTRQTGPDMDRLKKVWEVKMGELTDKNEEQLKDLRKNWDVEISGLKSDTEKLFTDLKNNLDKIDWSSVGKNMGSGISKGVKNATPEVTSSVQGTANAMINAANQTLEIQSPSKVFKRIGQFSVEGMVDGLKDKAGNIIDAGKNLGNSAINSLKSALSKVDELVNSDVNTNPVITPVLDLSNIKGGQRYLAGALGVTYDVGRSFNLADRVSTSRKETDSRDIVSELRDAVAASKNDVDLSGTFRVEVTNDKGEIIGVAEKAIKDILRRESR